MARTTFGLGVGPINLDLDWKDGRLAFAWMTQLKPTFGKTVTDARGAGGGARPRRRRGPAKAGHYARAGGQEVNCGSNFFIVPLPTRKAVDAAVLDRAKVDAVFAAAGIQRRGIYVFSVEHGADDVTAYSRMLPSGGIEDPATGSAVGPAGCFAAKYGFVPRERIGAMTFLQGVLRATAEPAARQGRDDRRRGHRAFRSAAPRSWSAKARCRCRGWEAMAEIEPIGWQGWLSVRALLLRPARGGARDAAADPGCHRHDCDRGTIRSEHKAAGKRRRTA